MAELDAAVGGASANSYISLEDAAEYFSMRLQTEAWDAAAEASREKALMQATRMLDRLHWTGSRTTSAQALAWPRTGTTLHGAALDGDAVPARIREACCELALALLRGYGGGFDGIDSFRLGGVSVNFSGPSQTFPPEVDRLIEPFRFAPRATLRLKRG